MVRAIQGRHGAVHARAAAAVVPLVPGEARAARVYSCVRACGGAGVMVACVVSHCGALVVVAVHAGLCVNAFLWL